VQVGNDRRHRLQHTDQREDHRNLDAASDGHGGQVDRIEVPEDHGIDHHHADGCQLGDQDGEGMGDQPLGSSTKHGALSHDERERLLRQGPAAGKTGLVDLPQAACFSTI
jgi:hypothetical protein